MPPSYTLYAPMREPHFGTLTGVEPSFNSMGRDSRDMSSAVLSLRSELRHLKIIELILRAHPYQVVHGEDTILSAYYNNLKNTALG